MKGCGILHFSSLHSSRFGTRLLWLLVVTLVVVAVVLLFPIRASGGRASDLRLVATLRDLTSPSLPV